MARGGYRVGAGRPKSAQKRSAEDVAPDVSGPVIMETRTPLEHMLDVMNNPLEDKGRRDRMAIAAAPFVHARAGEGPGKKEAKAEAAKKAATGRFAVAAPPKSVN